MGTGIVESEWESAVARAARIAAANCPPALRSEDQWDWIGVRGVLAVVLQVLAVQSGRSVEEVPLADVRHHCELGPDHIRDLAVHLVGDDLAHGLDVDPAAPARALGDPMKVTWLWLIRCWPQPTPDDDGPQEHRPAVRRWDGLNRGVARGQSGAAVDLLPGWAASAAAAAMGG